MVSVVIPARNMAGYLQAAIESVRCQTYADWDLHVVDDGSTDSTPQVAAQFQSDSRIRYWRQPNQERAAARNKGIRCSTGKYVAFLDADDLWQPEKLKNQVAELEAHPDAALCYTSARYIRRDGSVLEGQRQLTVPSGKALPQLARGNFISVSSVLIRRVALDAVGLFDIDPRLIGAEDWDLWLRIASVYAILGIPEELTLYRLHISPQSHRVILNGALAVVQKRFTDPNFQKLAEITRNDAEAYAYLSAAGFATPSIRRSERLKLMCRGISLAPPCIFSRAGLLAVARTMLPSHATGVLQRLAARLHLSSS